MAMASAHPPLRFDPEIVVARIREARETRAKMSRTELAAAAGMPRWALYKKERGTAPFSLEEISRLSDALGAPRLFPFLDWDTASAVQRMLDPAAPATSPDARASR